MNSTPPVPHGTAYITLTDANFNAEVLQADRPVLVDFWAAWCGPCRMIAPVIEELAVEYANQAKVAKVNVDEQPQLAAQYGIRSIPTLLIFKQGRLVDQIVGAVSRKVLTTQLNAQLA